MTDRAASVEHVSLSGGLRGIARAIVRPFRAVANGLLHPGRHRRVRERLANIARPRHILVICHANICR
ncbi:MAG TPA: hypothetical protein VIP11_06645, partial [Gemmatimonadaceae bacterium]